MGNKFYDYLIKIFVVALCLGVLWLFVEPIIWWSEKSEVRLYIRIFLFTFALNTFAVLRLYNSIVQNTRFSIKLREALLKFQGVITGLERSMKTLNGSLGGVKSSVDALRKETSDNTDKVEKLADRFKSANKNNN